MDPTLFAIPGLDATTAAAALVALAAAIPLAAWLAGGRAWHHRLLLGLALLPLLLPAAALLTALNPASAAALWQGLWAEHAGPAARLLGCTFYALPYPLLALYHYFGRVPQGLLQAAATLGAGPLDRFLTVTLPHSRGALAVAAILALSQAAGATALWQLPGAAANALPLFGLALLALAALLLAAPRGAVEGR